ncbi:MAG: DOMON-like domain-containing protein [Bdellovibrionia bacterium]
MTKLIPYPLKPGDPAHAQGPAGLKLEADVRLEDSQGQKKLVLTYSAGGALNHILWPASLSSHPQRRDELWKHTCFEAFIKPVGAGFKKEYWEINLSPAGDWNVYHFTNYREGMKREEAIHALHPTFTKDGDHWRLSCSLWVPAWSKATQLEIGLTSVIEETSGEISYWAIHHAGPQPDFHLAKSFSAVVSV